MAQVLNPQNPNPIVWVRELETAEIETRLKFGLNSLSKNRTSLVLVLPTKQAYFVYSRGIAYIDID